MITIYIIWTFLNGVYQDVDAFKTHEECRQAHEQITQMLEIARTQRPELEGLTISNCVPADVPKLRSL